MLRLFGPSVLDVSCCSMIQDAASSSSDLALVPQAAIVAAVAPVLVSSLTVQAVMPQTYFQLHRDEPSNGNFRHILFNPLTTESVALELGKSWTLGMDNDGLAYVVSNAGDTEWAVDLLPLQYFESTSGRRRLMDGQTSVGWADELYRLHRIQTVAGIREGDGVHGLDLQVAVVETPPRSGTVWVKIADLYEKMV